MTLHPKIKPTLTHYKTLLLQIDVRQDPYFMSALSKHTTYLSQTMSH